MHLYDYCCCSAYQFVGLLSQEGKFLVLRSHLIADFLKVVSYLALVIFQEKMQNGWGRSMDQTADLLVGGRPLYPQLSYDSSFITAVSLLA